MKKDWTFEKKKKKKGCPAENSFPSRLCALKQGYMM